MIQSFDKLQLLGLYMINIYTTNNSTINKVEIATDNLIVPGDTIWMDLYDPTSAQERLIEKEFNIALPTREEMGKIEVMSPFYQEGESYYMTITILDQSNSEYLNSAALTFILTPRCLITLRHTDIPSWRSFTSFVARTIKSKNVCYTAELCLMMVVDLLVNHAADVLEVAGNDLDILLQKVFSQADRKSSSDASPANYYNDIIARTGRTGNIISKNRESLVSINRMTIYFNQLEAITTKDQRTRLKYIAREIYSLGEYANFLSQRNSFLLDATLGMISVEQNMIIKVFTVAAAAFMPPTLIASIYGMNFHFIPELAWQFGYPLALFLIVVSALVPYTFFKKKGWL